MLIYAVVPDMILHSVCYFGGSFIPDKFHSTVQRTTGSNVLGLEYIYSSYIFWNLIN